MTRWEIFVEAVEAHSTLLSVLVLLVCIVGLIRELSKGWPRNGG